jgi:hypothetical protein
MGFLSGEFVLLNYFSTTLERTEPCFEYTDFFRLLGLFSEGLAVSALISLFKVRGVRYEEFLLIFWLGEGDLWDGLKLGRSRVLRR